MSIEDPENAEAYVNALRQTVCDNGVFTGVTDPDALVVRRYIVRGGTNTPRTIAVSFDNQTYEGMEVMYTPMYAVADRNGVISIDGHHYDFIYVPKRYHHHSNARRRLIGEEIQWEGWAGTQTWVIDDDSFTGEPELAVWPVVSDDRIELRVTWRFRVGPSGADREVFVDVMTLEWVGTIQLFVE